MAFTSWSALRTSLLDQLADNPQKMLNQSYRTPGGAMVTFRSLQEIFDFILSIDSKIDADTSGIPSTLVEFA